VSLYFLFATSARFILIYALNDKKAYRWAKRRINHA